MLIRIDVVQECDATKVNHGTEVGNTIMQQGFKRTFIKGDIQPKSPL